MGVGVKSNRGEKRVLKEDEGRETKKERGEWSQGMEVGEGGLWGGW